MITKEQVKNAQKRINSVKRNIISMQANYTSLSKILRELRLDSELAGDAAQAFEAVGVDLAEVTPALIKSMLHPSQIVPTKVGKETVDLISIFVEKQVYDEVEATLPDGTRKKVRLPKYQDGKKVTEIRTSPIREGKWSVSVLFTLLSQAVELNSAE